MSHQGSLREKQRVVFRGVGVGVATLLLLYDGGYALLPSLSAPESFEARMTLAVCCAVLPTIMLMAGIGQVANGRFVSEAIDPTANKESARMVIHGRYVDNTKQQLLLFLVADFGLYRAPGLAMTMCPSAIALIWLTWKVLTSAFT